MTTTGKNIQASRHQSSHFSSFRYDGEFLGYYGYWYSEDIYNTDSRAKAVTNNALIEATITTSGLSTLLWLGLTIFLIVVKRRTERRTSKNL